MINIMMIIKWDVKGKSKIWRRYIMYKVLGTAIWFMNSDEINDAQKFCWRGQERGGGLILHIMESVFVASVLALITRKGVFKCIFGKHKKIMICSI